MAWISWLSESDAIAVGHDIGRGGLDDPAITNNPSVAELLQKRMQVYHAAQSILLTSIPDSTEDAFMVDASLIDELFASGTERSGQGSPCQMMSWRRRCT